MTKRVFGKEDLDKIRDLYESGISLGMIGKEFGVTRIVITRVVKEIGIYKENRNHMSIDDHKKKLEEYKKVELVGEWINTQTKTLYRCLRHREIHPAYPGNVMKGHGLSCCTREGQQRHRDTIHENAASTYDDKIKEITEGNITRVGDYINNRTPIIHFCHRHNESHPSRPGNILSGFGLHCCRIAWSLDQAVSRNEKAKNLYDKKLSEKSDGRFKRLDEYIDATTPILHYCTIHQEEHLAIPNKLLNGDGMKCCNTGVGWDTLENLLENKTINVASDIEEPCQFYIFQVPNTEDCVKVGIAKSSLRRGRHTASKDLYGDIICVWQCSTRRNAILIETAVLRDPSFEYPSEIVDALVFKAGHSEVRRVDVDSLVSHVQFLFESLEEQGESWTSWALERIPSLRQWEIKALKAIR
jgi:hypothetical protein